MHSLNRGQDLPPLEFTPLPQVTELHGSFGWAQWNAAVASVQKLLRCCCEAIAGADPFETAWSDTVQLYPDDLMRARAARFTTQPQREETT